MTYVGSAESDTDVEARPVFGLGLILRSNDIRWAECCQHQQRVDARASHYVYRTALAPEKWFVRTCQCSFCRAHGVVSTSDPAGTVELSARDGALERYRFGQRTADFWICRNCGVYVAAVMEMSGRRYAVINVQALETHPPSLAAPTESSLDGESKAQRDERRLQRWTPVVER